MSEKLSPVERALIAAASMPSPQARKVLMMLCEAGLKGGDGNANGDGNSAATLAAPTVQSAGAAHYARREKFIKRTKSAIDRVCNYARHETLRNIEKHFRETPPITSAEGDPNEPGSLAARLTFKKPIFTDELLAALREEAIPALSVAGQQLFDEVGRDSPWRMPSEYATGFLNYRANLLSNVPDEVHAEIMQSIQDGLNAGETRKELMSRIASKWDEISTGRAETIANTETAAAFNFARDRAMKEAGVTHKKWLHSESPLIKEARQTHLDINGQLVPIDEPFDVGGVQMMHPGDDMLGAGPEDIINCHCVAIPVERPIQSGDEKGHPFRGNQWVAVGGRETLSDGQLAWNEGVKIAGANRVKLHDFMRADVTRPNERPAIAITADDQRFKVAADHAWSYYQKSPDFDPKADPPKEWRNETLIDKAFADWMGIKIKPRKKI